MKIISKFKDYYDYLQGIYSVDDKLILDRTKYTPLSYKPSVKTKHSLYIGNLQVDVLWIDGKPYTGNDVEQFSDKRLANKFWSFPKDTNKEESWIVPNKMRNIIILKKPKNLDDKSPTWKYDCPILINRADKYFNSDNDYEFHPILKEYNIQKVLSAHEIWIELSEWLGKKITKNEPIVPIGDDKTRILNAGFDLKTSFRKL